MLPFNPPQFWGGAYPQDSVLKKPAIGTPFAQPPKVAYSFGGHNATKGASFSHRAKPILLAILTSSKVVFFWPMAFPPLWLYWKTQMGEFIFGRCVSWTDDFSLYPPNGKKCIMGGRSVSWAVTPKVWKTDLSPQNNDHLESARMPRVLLSHMDDTNYLF